VEEASENSAGVARVTMLKRASASNAIARIEVLGDLVRYNPMDPAASASIIEPVRFCAQFRTNHDKTENVSGEVQFIHDGRMVSSLPLSSGADENGASFVAVDVTLPTHPEPLRRDREARSQRSSSQRRSFA
jgi:hypothetical protein